MEATFYKYGSNYQGYYKMKITYQQIYITRYVKNVNIFGNIDYSL